ncbi:TRM32-like protein [Tanacetum coccineum]
MNLKLKKSDFLMAKRLKQRLAARQHKDRVGCMSGIVGSLYPTSEGNSLTDSEEIRQQIESPNNEKNETTQTRVKELMEEEMQCDQAGDLEDLIDHQLPSQKTAQYHELEDFVNKLLVIHQEKNEEEEKPKSLERSNSLDHKRSNPVSEEHVTRKPRNFFKRRTKSHECISLNDSDITPPSITPNSFHHERSASHFSFTEIKKKLKNAMTRSPRHPGCLEKPIVDGNSGWSSPNRDHFYSERFSRISNRFKRQDEVSRLSKSERKTGENLDFGETSERVSNIYFEAKKHLSEMLNNENEHTELTVEDHSRSLGKLLAFPGYSSLSLGIDPRNEPMINESQPSVTYAEDQKPEILEEVHQAEDVVEIVKPPSLEENEVTDVPVMKNFQDFSEEDELSCSPIASPSGSSLVINRKSEEVESTSDDKTGKPSPISVLEPMFSDDDISPARTISRSAESSMQPLRIRFEDTVTLGKNQETCSLNSVENEESIFEYIEAVLLASDLNWDEFEKRWLSSIPILDPSLYDELQIFSSRPADDQLLLFDTTNEILEEICDRSLGLFPELSCLKRNIHPLPKGIGIINKVWNRIESRLNCQYSISLDQLIEKDLEVSKTWMDLRSETREIVIETEEWIFEDMIDDAVLSLMHA